jgi:hypothetical protein
MDIHVPERCPKTASAMLRDCPESVNVYPGYYLHDMLDMFDRRTKFNVVYLDTMSVICGSRTKEINITPLDDTRRILMHHAPNKLVFAGTFVGRNRKGTGRYRSSLQKTKTRLRNLIKFCGYRIVTPMWRMYKRIGEGTSMQFFKATLVKMPTYDANRIVFDVDEYLGTRVTAAGTKEVLVQWSGYREPTWEPASNHPGHARPCLTMLDHA